jgi:hypothetical protein
MHVFCVGRKPAQLLIMEFFDIVFCILHVPAAVDEKGIFAAFSSEKVLAKIHMQDLNATQTPRGGKLRTSEHHHEGPFLWRPLSQNWGKGTLGGLLITYRV